jgi:hypothetical protein
MLQTKHMNKSQRVAFQLHGLLFVSLVLAITFLIISLLPIEDVELSLLPEFGTIQYFKFYFVVLVVMGTVIIVSYILSFVVWLYFARLKWSRSEIVKMFEQAYTKKKDLTAPLVKYLLRIGSAKSRT